AAEQYFSTLAIKYNAQIDPACAQKVALKGVGTRITNRKRTKQARRLAALPAFKIKHNIDTEHDLAYLLDLGYMSAEEDGPGNVSKESWDAEARKVAGAGQTVFETQRLPWRTQKLIRFYYALDNESFNPSDTSVKRAKISHVRFHGFKENTSRSLPRPSAHRQLVPFYIVEEKWLHATGNTGIAFNRSPEPEAWATLVINDSELDPRDLEAMQKWIAEEESN
ncbi:hypothetical protein BDN70DRAFT_815784, partial [Pholiota conissans]